MPPDIRIRQREKRKKSDCESKRDFILSNPKINDKGIRILVNFADDLLNQIELLYDDIIYNNGIDSDNLNIKIKTISNKLDKLKGRLYESGL